MKNLDVLCCTVRPMAGYQSVRKADDQYRLLFTTPGMDQRETGILMVGHRPPCVYHLSTVAVKIKFTFRDRATIVLQRIAAAFEFSVPYGTRSRNAYIYGYA